jgi:hypothetical protein
VERGHYLVALTGRIMETGKIMESVLGEAHNN